MASQRGSTERQLRASWVPLSPYRVSRGSVPVARKYWLKFSSPESTVPHGVVPPAQLFMVPRTRRPVLSSAVFSRSEPAAGPSTRNCVLRVIRRLSRAPLT